MKKEIIAATSIMITVAFPAQSQPALTETEAATEENVRGCVKFTSLSKVDCECIASVSKKLSNNSDIFNIYIQAKEPEVAKQIYDDIIDGNAYNNHNFSTRREKEEFIQGKALLFAREIGKACEGL